jgi:hypothetical protein
MSLGFQAELWRYDGDAAWYFLTLPADEAEEVRQVSAHTRRGFGSVRVEATVGTTTWRTSVFPDKASGGYLLPVKAEVRKRERIDAGDTVRCRITLVG